MTRPWAGLLFAVALALAPMALPAGAAAAEPPMMGFEGGIARAEPFPGTTAQNLAPVRIRVWPHDSYGRIVFDWPAPVTYSAKAEGGRIVISFARPFAAVLRRIRQRLSAAPNRGVGEQFGGRVFRQRLGEKVPLAELAIQVSQEF